MRAQSCQPEAAPSIHTHTRTCGLKNMPTDDPTQTTAPRHAAVYPQPSTTRPFTDTHTPHPPGIYSVDGPTVPSPAPCSLSLGLQQIARHTLLRMNMLPEVPSQPQAAGICRQKGLRERGRQGLPPGTAETGTLLPSPAVVPFPKSNQSKAANLLIPRADESCHLPGWHRVAEWTHTRPTNPHQGSQCGTKYQPMCAQAQAGGRTGVSGQLPPSQRILAPEHQALLMEAKGWLSGWLQAGPPSGLGLLTYPPRTQIDQG